jgi:hypothetical protein
VLHRNDRYKHEKIRKINIEPGDGGKSEDKKLYEKLKEGHLSETELLNVFHVP